MVPEKLKIKGFLSYRAPQVLDFTKFDLAIITGDNGHGKSSLIDAMVFALYGVGRGGREKEDLINVNEKEASVELTFKEKGTIYRVKRTLKREKPSTLILEAFDREANTFKNISEGKITETEEKIEKIIGLNYDTFVTASFMLQDQSDYFTSKTPSEKIEILREMFNLEVFEQAKDKAKEKKKDLIKENEDLSNEINGLEKNIGEEEAIRNTLKDIENRISHNEEMHREIKEKREKLEKLNGEKIRIKTRMDYLLHSKNEHLTHLKQLKEDLEKIGKEMEELREIVNGRDEIIKNYEALRKLREKIKELSLIEKQFRELNIEKAGIERLIKEREESLKKRIDEEEKSIENLREELQKNSKKYLLLEEERNRYLSEITKEQEERETVKKHITDLQNEYNEYLQYTFRLTELKNSEDSKRKEIERVNKDRESFEEEYERNKREIESLTKRCDTLLKEKNEKNTLLEKIKGEVYKKESIAHEIEEINNTMVRFKNLEGEEKKKLSLISSQTPVCPLCGSPLTEIHRKALKEKFEENIKAYSKALKEETEKKKIKEEELRYIQEKEKELKEIEISIGKLETEYENMEERKTYLTDELGRIFEKIEEKREELRKREEELNNIVRDIEICTLKVKEKEPISKQLKEEETHLESLETHLKEVEKQFSSNVTGELNTKSTIEQLESSLERAMHNLDTLKNEYKTRSFVEEEEKTLKEIVEKIEALSFNEEEFLALKKSEENLSLFEEKFVKLGNAEIKIEEKKKEQKKINEEMEALLEKINALDNELQEIEEKLKNLGDVETLLKEIKEKENEMQEILQDLYGEKAKIEEKLNNIAKIKMDIAHLKIQIKDNAEKIEILSYLEEILGRNGIQIAILRDFLPYLEMEVNKFLEKLTDRKMHLKFETLKGEGKIDKPTLDILIYDNGANRRYELFSGGEKFRINFAIRLGIAKFLAHFRNALLEILVIDEGFGSQDARGRINILESINAIRSDFKKILVLSHLNEIKENFPYEIKVIKDINGSRIEIP